MERAMMVLASAVKLCGDQLRNVALDGMPVMDASLIADAFQAARQGRDRTFRNSAPGGTVRIQAIHGRCLVLLHLHSQWGRIRPVFDTLARMLATGQAGIELVVDASSLHEALDPMTFAVLVPKPAAGTEPLRSLHVLLQGAMHNQPVLGVFIGMAARHTEVTLVRCCCCMELLMPLCLLDGPHVTLNLPNASQLGAHGMRFLASDALPYGARAGAVEHGSLRALRAAARAAEPLSDGAGPRAVLPAGWRRARCGAAAAPGY